MKIGYLYIIKILIPVCISISAVHPFSSEDADRSIEAFNGVYWDSSAQYFFKKDDQTGSLDFWMSAHVWETLMDVYVRTGDTAYLAQVRSFYEGFVDKWGADWTTNDYNDDIMWWALACTKAYSITGLTRYRDQAKTHFDWIFATQKDDTFGGGIWWKNSSHNEKNSCVNSPAIITAVKLAGILNDTAYLDKARELYTWQKNTLTDGNGRVFDHINSDGVTNWAITYNQGTFMGAAQGLGHIEDAVKAAEWTRNNLCQAGYILKDEGQGDGGAFKLVFVRYIAELIYDAGQDQFEQWMVDNANSAWNNRRETDDIMWKNWAETPPASGIECQVAAAGVRLLNVIEPDSQTVISSEHVIGEKLANNLSIAGNQIHYSVPDAGCHVTLEMYSMAGKRIAVLVDRYHTAGKYAVQPHSDMNAQVAKGAYILRLHIGSVKKTIRFVAQ